MDIDAAQRPREVVEPYDDLTPRTKCTLCCGLVNSAYVFAGSFAIFTLPAIGIHGVYAVTRSFSAFLNITMLLPLPLACISFTHQTILSETLWSRQKKTLFDCNMTSITLNTALWLGILAGGTYVSRSVLPKWSPAYRVALWDYQRTRRSAMNKWLPSTFGTVKEDLDWYNFFWTMNLYHTMWAGVAVLLDRQMHAQYSLFHKDFSFSRRCSPRWREWRESRVSEVVKQYEQPTRTQRWGSVITLDKWRSGKA